jgi:hypothetical protein
MRDKNRLMWQVYPREGCVRGLLQEGPGQAAAGGQVRLCRQREEYAQQTQGDSFRQDLPASRSKTKSLFRCAREVTITPGT